MKSKMVEGQGRTAEVPDQVTERGGQKRTLASLLTQRGATWERQGGTHFTFPLWRLDLDV